MKNNRFDRFHPLVSFLFYAGSILLLILMLHPIFLGAAMVIVLLINVIHDRLRGLGRWLFLICTTFLLMLVMNPLFNERGRYVLFEIYQHRVTLEAIVYGGMNALSIIGIIALFVSFNVMMPPNKLLFLFAKIMPQFTVLLMLTLRFIPLMRRRVEEISTIQKSKGISVSHGNWGTKVRTGMLYVQTLLTFSLEEAIQTADSMKARGYGKGIRTSYEYFKFRNADAIAIVFLLSLFSCIIYGRLLGFGFLTIYPIMETWKFTRMDTEMLLCYILFMSFPLLVEAGGVFRWR